MNIPPLYSDLPIRLECLIQLGDVDTETCGLCMIFDGKVCGDVCAVASSLGPSWELDYLRVDGLRKPQYTHIIAPALGNPAIVPPSIDEVFYDFSVIFGRGEAQEVRNWRVELKKAKECYRSKEMYRIPGTVKRVKIW